MRRRPSTPRGRGALGERAWLGEAAPCPPPRQRPGWRCPGRAPLMPGVVPRRRGCAGRSCPLAGGLRGPAWPGPAHPRRLRRAAERPQPGPPPAAACGRGTALPPGPEPRALLPARGEAGARARPGPRWGGGGAGTYPPDTGLEIAPYKRG